MSLRARGSSKTQRRNVALNQKDRSSSNDLILRCVNVTRLQFYRAPLAASRAYQTQQVQNMNSSYGVLHYFRTSEHECMFEVVHVYIINTLDATYT